MKRYAKLHLCYKTGSRPIDSIFFCRRKMDAAKFVVPEYMNPKVRLKNIWDELADVGVAVNLLPPGNINKTISIRYNTKTQSLFTDDNGDT